MVWQLNSVWCGVLSPCPCEAADGGCPASQSSAAEVGTSETMWCPPCCAPSGRNPYLTDSLTATLCGSPCRRAPGFPRWHGPWFLPLSLGCVRCLLERGGGWGGAHSRLHSGSWFTIMPYRTCDAIKYSPCMRVPLCVICVFVGRGGSIRCRSVRCVCVHHTTPPWLRYCCFGECDGRMVAAGMP